MRPFFFLIASTFILAFAGCVHKEIIPGVKTYDYLQRPGTGLMTEAEYTTVAQTAYDGIVHVMTTAVCLSTNWEDGNYSKPYSAVIIGNISNDEITDTVFSVENHLFAGITPRQLVQSPAPENYFYQEQADFSEFIGGDTLHLEIWDTTLTLYHPAPFIMPRAPMEWDAPTKECQEYIDRDQFTVYWNADEQNPLGVIITIQSQNSHSDIYRPMRRFIVPDNGQFKIPPADLSVYKPHERISFEVTRGNYHVFEFANGRKLLFWTKQTASQVETELR